MATKNSIRIFMGLITALFIGLNDAKAYSSSALTTVLTETKAGQQLAREILGLDVAGFNALTVPQRTAAILKKLEENPTLTAQITKQVEQVQSLVSAKGLSMEAAASEALAFTKANGQIRFTNANADAAKVKGLLKQATQTTVDDPIRSAFSKRLNEPGVDAVAAREAIRSSTEAGKVMGWNTILGEGASKCAQEFQPETLNRLAVWVNDTAQGMLTAAAGTSDKAIVLKEGAEAGIASIKSQLGVTAEEASYRSCELAGGSCKVLHPQIAEVMCR